MFEIGQKAEENMQPSNELCFLIPYQVTFFLMFQITITSLCCLQVCGYCRDLNFSEHFISQRQQLGFISVLISKP